MKVLYRYMLKEFFMMFGIFLLVFVSIYLMTEFFRKLDDVAESGSLLYIIIPYFLLKIPFIMTQMIPVATLLSVIILFSLMLKNYELVALRASGIGLVKCSMPIIICGCIVVILSFIISEFVVPVTSSKSNDIWRLHVKKIGNMHSLGRNNIWYKNAETGSIYWISRFNPENNEIRKASLYFFKKDVFSLDRRVNIDAAQWDGEKWVAKYADIIISEAEGGFNSERINNFVLPIIETPSDFLKIERKPEELNFWGLMEFARKVSAEGYNNTRYVVESNIKLAMPFVNLILAIAGIPIVLGIRYGGTPMAVCIGVGICFLYLMTMGIFRSFGIAGIIPPVLSAWAANGILLFFVLHFFMRMDTSGIFVRR